MPGVPCRLLKLGNSGDGFALDCQHNQEVSAFAWSLPMLARGRESRELSEGCKTRALRWLTRDSSGSAVSAIGPEKSLTPNEVVVLRVRVGRRSAREDRVLDTTMLPKAASC